MKEITFYDTGSLITNLDIDNFEKKFNIIFPPNYRYLLLKFNGGIPSDDCIYIEGEEGSIGGFYSLKGNDILLENAIQDFQIIEKLIPKEYIPIAYDSFGNPYCIATYEKDYGKIFCWFLDSGDEEGTLIANSLEEFLGGEV